MYLWGPTLRKQGWPWVFGGEAPKLSRYPHLGSSSHCLDLAWDRFGALQRLKTLVETRHSFQGDLIALVQVVAPLFIDTPEAVSTRVASSIYPVPDLWTWLRLSGADRDKPVHSQGFNRFVEKGLCVTPQGQAEVAHQANCLGNTL